MAAVWPVARLLLQITSLHKVCQRPFHRRAGKSQVSSDGVDPRPASALFVGVILQVNIHRFGPVAQFGVLVDGIIVGQFITSHPGLGEVCPASWERSPAVALSGCDHSAGYIHRLSAQTFLFAGDGPFLPSPAPSRTVR